MSLDLVRELATKDKHLTDSIKALEEKVKELKQDREPIRKQIIDILKNNNMKDIKLPGIGHFIHVIKQRFSAADPNLLREFCLDNGYAALLTVNSQRLQTFAKELSEEADISRVGISVFEEDSISVRKA